VQRAVRYGRVFRPQPLVSIRPRADVKNPACLVRHVVHIWNSMYFLSAYHLRESIVGHKARRSHIVMEKLPATPFLSPLFSDQSSKSPCIEDGSSLSFWRFVQAVRPYAQATEPPCSIFLAGSSLPWTDTSLQMMLVHPSSREFDSLARL
jgi:hypothetical protein